MVTSFKDNPYGERVYQIDKSMANNEYSTIYYIPLLEINLDYVHQHYTYSDEAEVKKAAEKLMVVRNETK